MRVLPAIVAAAALAWPATAAAAPPPNDQRTAPQRVSLPASVDGTTRDSTLEADEPGSCAQLRGSVWYELDTASKQRIVVRLAAAGDLDATVDVFRRTRSQLAPVDCDVTDDKGKAELAFTSDAAPASYLIRVGQRRGSVAGSFRLDVFAPQPPPRPPGPRLPRRGAARTLDAVQDTADAWSMTMRAGRTYRVNLAHDDGACLSLALYPPGTSDFDQDPAVLDESCGGYATFTPRAGQGGRYSMLVRAQSRRRGPQRYHLQAGLARADDMAPGLPLPNHRRVRGHLAGNRLDAVDLYRFSLARRSDVRLVAGGGAGFGMRILDDRGRTVGSSAEGVLEQPVAPGRYFVAVEASAQQRGRYTLRRDARIITAASVSMAGRRSATAAPGATVPVRVAIAPATSGPVDLTLERFDPLAGWQFFRLVRLHAAGGRATYGFRPPAQGRWRASAAFRGTRDFAPSASGTAEVLVAPPLGT